jgi:DNA-binding protein HU-beta
MRLRGGSGVDFGTQTVCLGRGPETGGGVLAFGGLNRAYDSKRITTKDDPMSKPMTKTQLVAAVADAMGGDKKTANAALDAIAAVVSREVASGGTVTIPGLGKVACKARPERQVRNPATGETMTKPADKQVKFAIAKALKDVVNA